MKVLCNLDRGEKNKPTLNLPLPPVFPLLTPENQLATSETPGQIAPEVNGTSQGICSSSLNFFGECLEKMKHLTEAKAATPSFSTQQI